jgi:two-component system chemotaxis sensor kinase CheA
MKLTARFASLVFVLLVSVGVSAFAGLSALRQQHIALDAVMNEDTRRLLVITDVRRLFRGMKVQEREQILERDDQHALAMTEVTRSMRDSLAKSLATYASIMPEADRPAVEQLRGAFVRWTDLDDRVVRLALAHEGEAAYELARTHTSDPVSWETLIAGLVASNESRLNRQVAAAGDTYHVGRNVLLASALGAAVFAMIVGSAVFRGIQRMLAEVLATNANLEGLVDQRTQALRAREASMRLMLDNVGDGFFTVDMAGMISAQRSAATDRWFGAVDGEVALWDYLGRIDAKAVDWVKLTFDDFRAAEMPTCVTVDQFPKRLHADGRDLAIEWSALGGEEATTGLLVVVHDVTAQLLAERAEAEQRELARMMQRIAQDKAEFLGFLIDSRTMIEKLQHGGVGPVEAGRIVHTLKGNAGMFGMVGFADLCHEIEQQWTDQARAISSGDVDALNVAWNAIENKVRTLVESPRVTAIEIDDAEYMGIVQAVLDGVPRAHILHQISLWKFEPTRVRLGRLARQAEALASRLSKGPVDVRVEDGGLRLPAQKWQAFWSAMVHVVRNAVDHGLESVEERAALGKGRARITLRTQIRGASLVVACEDDGRGVDWEKLRARGAALGLPHDTEKALVDLMMRDGVSTREEATDCSGRGVGMSAIGGACRDLGGDVSIHSEGSVGTTIEFHFPTAAMVDESTTRLLRRPAKESRAELALVRGA